MQLLLTYDVSTIDPEGRRRLRQMAKLCEGYGHRVQKSVFEITCTDAELLTLLDGANRIIDPGEDSVRIYRLPANGFTALYRIGNAKPVPHHDPLIM
ncbi:CRISPR-associated endonuclease Cas2 [Thermostaphylospora chromogena]|mgnify:CR=1 FL=1|uniref:CRISPR-associated endoribonuclease Cas2 n=1 Tax=Thermostaphylospora chromogena TaxID=35622 RepID=A0A1H1CB20_9ACTN|nr:CRISPR-associated endonuclease Cas2 [Thermostaphylospora chromogena]SDQ60846.1 CRISPR-associated protein, Cas2 family [Thermostaphylospora chromogena]